MAENAEVNSVGREQNETIKRSSHASHLKNGLSDKIAQSLTSMLQTGFITSLPENLSSNITEDADLEDCRDNRDE